MQASRSQEGYVVAIGIFDLFCGELMLDSDPSAAAETHCFLHIALSSDLHHYGIGRRILFIVPVCCDQKFR